MTGLGAKRTEAAERVVGELTKRDRQIAALTFELAARSGAHSISIVGCKWGIKTLVHMKHVAPPPSTLQQEKGDEPSKGLKPKPDAQPTPPRPPPPSTAVVQ